MSAGAPAISVPRAPAEPTRVHTADRPWLRLAAFTALAGYALIRWATLLRPGPGWRLVGLLVVAVAVAGGLPLIARRTRLGAAGVGLVLLLVTFPVAGLRWEWFRHLRITVSAEWIGTGLQRLPNVLVPYVGHDQTVRLVIVLGAAVLLLDAAAVLAFAPRTFGDGRRAAAALPLIALAIVPSTLIRPELPYLQGLILFGLLALFVWGERLAARPATLSAAALLAVAGVAGALVAPRIDPRSPLVNYRAWAGTVVRRHVDVFDWNQTYGPLRWPHAGHVVLTVRARTADYWKAGDLDTFNGYAWVQAGAQPQVIQPALPAPSRADLAKWTQTIQVTIDGMRTQQVIAAGSAQEPSSLPGGLSQGLDAGTWVAGQELGPGTSYQVSTYSPRPTAAQLRAAGNGYPAGELVGDLTLAIPLLKPNEGPALHVQFPLFRTSGTPSVSVPGDVPDATPVLRTSPYARAYRLARRLAAASRTPYAFVEAVQRYLRHGFTYSNTPPVRAYPLESFLFNDKKGYCQQFSGAMALLLRMGGVPARVASGFTSGTYNAASHEWVVDDTDAHAWVEVWFPRYGWVRFDPTPGGTGGQNGVSPIQAAIQKELPQAAALLKAGERSAQSPTPAGGTAGPHRTSGGGFPVWPVAGAAVMLAGLIAAALLLLRSGSDPESQLAELERAMARSGRPLRPGATLVGLEQRLAATPEAAAYVRTLRQARYGGGVRGPTAAERRALRRELGRGLGLSGRLRALWALPPRWGRPPEAHGEAMAERLGAQAP